MSEKTIKLPDIPAATTIAATDRLVRTDGKTMTVEEVAQATIPFFSCRNLISGGKEIEMAAATTNHSYKVFNLSTSVAVGDIISVAVEKVETTHPQGKVSVGLYARIDGTETNITTSYPKITTLGSKSYVKLRVAKDHTSPYLLVYNGVADSTMGHVSTVKGLTVVRGSVPMLGWLPSPEENWGGVNALWLNALHFLTAEAEKGVRHERQGDEDGGMAERAGIGDELVECDFSPCRKQRGGIEESRVVVDTAVVAVPFGGPHGRCGHIDCGDISRVDTVKYGRHVSFRVRLGIRFADSAGLQWRYIPDIDNSVGEAGYKRSQRVRLPHLESDLMTAVGKEVAA